MTCTVTGDPGRECGLFCWKPQCLQCFATIFCFVIFYCPSSLLTSGLSVYISSQITTLEKFFGLSSAQSGFLLSCNDIGYLLTTLIASFAARKVHIPQSLSISTVLYGISGIICSFAFFLSPEYTVSRQLNAKLFNDSNTEQENVPTFGGGAQICHFTNSTNHKDHDPCTALVSKTGTPSSFTPVAMTIIAVGMTFQGFGKSPRQSFITTYVDDNVIQKQKTACYLGIISAVGIFGPVLGFGLGGLFSTIYVTLEDVSISIRDPRWVGAWWLGFIVFGVSAIITALPLCCFPRRLTPKRKRIVDSDESAANWKFISSTKSFFSAIRRLLCNPLYTINVIAVCIALFLVSGFLAFSPKYLETQFGLPTVYANILVGSMTVAAASVGTILGGAIVTYFKLSPLSCAKMVLAANALSTLAAIAGLFLGCPTPEIIGFKSNLDGLTDMSTTTSTTVCGSACHCDDTDYFPVCGSDDKNYFSPCHAGCTDISKETRTYTNCSCVDGNSTATTGLCPSQCNMLWPYMVTSLFGGLVSTLAIIPGLIFQLRVVSFKDKSLAVGLSAFLHTLIGWIPGPVVGGKIIDSTCLLWTRSCHGSGACALYSNENYRFQRYIIDVTAKIIIVILFTILVLLARKKDWKVDVNDERTTNDDVTEPCINPEVSEKMT